MWENLDLLLLSYINEHKIPGITASVIVGSTPVYERAIGFGDIETKARMRFDTLLRLASISKVVTSVAALILIEENKLGLDDAVSDFIPQFRKIDVVTSNGTNVPLENPVTLSHLLTHMAGFGYEFTVPPPLRERYRSAHLFEPQDTLATMMTKLATLPLLFQPGSGWCYGASTDVLGRVIEVVSNSNLEDFFRERIFAPLDMKDTGFLVPRTKLNRVATLYGPWRDGQYKRVKQPEESDFNKKKLFAGGGGLYSTASDFKKFATMLLNQGCHETQQIISPQSLKLMATNHLPDKLLPYSISEYAKYRTVNYGFGFNVRVKQRQNGALPQSEIGEYGWAGSTNTYFWVDPARELAVILFAYSTPFTYYPIEAEFMCELYKTLDSDD